MATKNSKKIEQLNSDLDLQIEKLANALDSLHRTVSLMENGGVDNFPLWNGNNACSFIKSTYSQIEKDNTLLDYIFECKQEIKKS